MDRLVVDFVRVLREHRLRVSPAEELDALDALRATGIAERWVVRDALRATLVKDSQDVPAFDELFDAFFALGGKQAGGSQPAGHRHDTAAGQPTELRFGEDLEGPPDPQHTHEPPTPMDLRRFLEEDQITPGSDLHGEPERLRLSVFGSQLMLSHNQDALEQAIKRMVHQLRVRRARSFSPGEVAAESGTQELPLDLVDVQFEELLDELREHGVAPELVEAVQASAEEILAALPDLLRSLMDRQERLRAVRAQEPREPDRALRRLLDLSPGDQRELELAIRRLARRLHGAHTRRLRPARRGKVSVPQTLRRNMAYEGVPFAPVLRRRREQRPRLVVLLDVSLSTRNLARFWLQLVWELQSLFSRVRTFAFVADLVEVTPLFAEQGLEAGVQTLFAGELIDVDENSDFGRAIEELYEAHLGALTRRTTLVVLGDGRNNGRSPNTTRFAELTRHCRRTLWMTPEPRWGWQLGSCDMPAYAEACDAVEVVRSVEDLGHFAERVLAE
jgi:uncharacterized protein with von Willebrand factor type A (vWA) domain